MPGPRSAGRDLVSSGAFNPNGSVCHVLSLGMNQVASQATPESGMWKGKRVDRGYAPVSLTTCGMARIGLIGNGTARTGLAGFGIG